VRAGARELRRGGRRTRAVAEGAGCSTRCCRTGTSPSWTSRATTVASTSVGSSFAQPRVTGQLDVGGSRFDKLSGVPELRRLRLQDVDLSHAALDGLLLTDCRFVHCVFDEASCRHLGQWAVSYRDCRFRSADLRESGFGAWFRPRRRRRRAPNRFERVDFSGADFRDVDQQRISAGSPTLSPPELVRGKRLPPVGRWRIRSSIANVRRRVAEDWGQVGVETFAHYRRREFEMTS